MYLGDYDITATAIIIAIIFINTISHELPILYQVSLNSRWDGSMKDTLFISLK